MDVVWPLRRWIWDGMTLLKYRATKPEPIPPPEEGQPPLEPVSLARLIPAVPIENILVADRIPPDEASPRNQRFYTFQVAMYRYFPAMQNDLPPVDTDPQRALDRAYSRFHRRLFPKPVVPAEYEHPDLGELAVASPYACYVQRAPDGSFEWDFRVLDAYEIHDGLLPLGVHVRFTVDEATRKLRPAEIDSELGRSRPGDENWDRAQRMALCAATTYTSLVRHYNWVHLASGGPLAMATRNRLPAAHPVHRLLRPHIFRTQYSNYITTMGQLVKGGDFDSIFSFTHRGVCKLYEESYERFDALTLDPAGDARRRGIVDAGFDTPALDNYVALSEVMQAHAGRYLRRYYGSDGDLRDDEHVQAWIDDLDRLVPGGVRTAFGGATNIDDTGRLIGALVYLTTVVHDVLGTGLWNYQMWTHVQPVRMYKTDQRVPLDVFQRLVNANFLLNVHRAPLMQDFSYLALDAPGAEAFRSFQSDLETLQAELEKQPFACWRVYPRMLEANING